MNSGVGFIFLPVICLRRRMRRRAGYLSISAFGGRAGAAGSTAVMSQWVAQQA